MTKDNNTDIAVIKEQVSEVKRWINNADRNHFPTIEKRFNRIEIRLALYAGGLAVLTFLAPFIIDNL